MHNCRYATINSTHILFISELFRFEEHRDEHNFCNRSKSSALSLAVQLVYFINKMSEIPAACTTQWPSATNHWHIQAFCSNLHSSYFSNLKAFLHWGTPKWTRYSKCHLKNVRLHDTHFLDFNYFILTNTAQYSISFYCCKGALQPLIQLAFTSIRHPSKNFFPQRHFTDDRGWKGPLEIQAVSPKASCLGPCPDGFWLPPRMEILQPLWSTCASS